MRQSKRIINLLCSTSAHVFILLLFLVFQPNLYAQGWHPDITHRPRLVYQSSDVPTIAERLSSGNYLMLWNNDYSSRRGSFIGGIYQKAAQEAESIPNTEEAPRNFADGRAWIAKCAAFVYAMNRRSDGINNLDEYSGPSDPYPRDWYKEHALIYLRSLDPIVLGPDNIFELADKAEYVNNWQWRTKELINYCHAYDMLLGAEVSIADSITDRLEQFAQNLYQKYTAQYVETYLIAKNNHRLMIASALGIAAITLNESQHANDWIQLAMSVIQYVLFEDGSDGLRQVDSDGGYAEGPYYLRYSFKHLIPFFIAMRNFNGDWTEDYTYNSITRSLQSPWYDTKYYKIYDWITKIRMPEGRLPALEDSFQDHYLPDLAIFGGYYSWPYHSFDETLSDETLLNWQLADPFDLRIEYIAAGNTLVGDVPGDWDNVQILPEAGSAVFRSDWGSEAIYLHLYGQHGSARQAGSTHDHADVTSFILGYKGQVLALDAGYIRFNYHYQVNKPQNHNLILVDGFGPKPPSGPVVRWSGIGLPTFYSSPSPTDGYFDNSYISEEFSYVDVSAQYSRHYEMIDSLDSQEVWEYISDDTSNVVITRGSLFADNRYFVIDDAVDNAHTTTKKYQFLLHGNGGGTSGGSYELLSNGAVWSQGDATLVAYITAIGGKVNLSDSLFLHGDGFLTPKTHMCLRASKEAEDTKFLSVLFPLENSTSPEVFDITTAEYAGLILYRDESAPAGRYDIIISQQEQDSLYIPQHTFGNIDIKSIATDAQLLLMSFDQQDPDNPDLMKIFGKGISFLTYDEGRIVFQPASNITSSFGYIIDAMDDMSYDQPTKFALRQNYPNPFNPETVISWQVGATGRAPVQVELSIYNVLGQKVCTLISEKKKAGYYKIEWDASGLASGIYYYRLQAEGFVETRKLVLLK
jgi:hypothetical protein